jgi:hypothetical protein
MMNMRWLELCDERRRRRCELGTGSWAVAGWVLSLRLSFGKASSSGVVSGM